MPQQPRPYAVPQTTPKMRLPVRAFGSVPQGVRRGAVPHLEVVAFVSKVAEHFPVY